MNKNTTFHSYKIKDIRDKFAEGDILIDDSYQRRSVWMLRDKIRLIETILNDYLVPPLYFWDAETDPDSGLIRKHIVDGQQRVAAIVDFIEGVFKLDRKYLTIEGENEYSDQYFKDLNSDLKTKLWSYDLPAIDLRSEVTENQIRNIFTRLNLTEYSLNSQERRHSSNQGEFSEAAYLIADMNFWIENNIFSAADLRRMGDIEFCASLLLLARKGIVDQTTQKVLNDAYSDFSESYPDKEKDIEIVTTWMETITPFIEKRTRRFLKKTQLYSLFCLADYITNRKIEVTEEHVEKFVKYVENYQLFKSEEDGSAVDSHLIDLITTHKLAASEGLNKQKNRMLRFESIRNAVFGK